jgi:flagellar protein FlaG
MEVKNTPVPFFPKPIDRATANPVKALERPEPQGTEKKEEITKELLKNKVEKMNELLEQTSTAIKYQLHEELNVYYVQVVDSISEEVLKEIPNKKFLDMYASMAEFLGLIVDDKL